MVMERVDAHEIVKSFNEYFSNIGNILPYIIPNTNILPLSFMDSTQTSGLGVINKYLRMR